METSTSKELMQEADLRKYQMMKARSRVVDIGYSLFRYLLVIGISFIIIYPILQKISTAFKHKSDIYNPMIYMIPVNLTLDNLKVAMDIMNYWPVLQNTLLFAAGTTLLTTASCALAGYGFARFQFPGSNILFVLVVVTILVPSSTLMVPMYLHFRSFDFFGLIEWLTGQKGISLLNTIWPSLITAATAVSLKAGLFIYIFRQFFKGMPREIEEAALIDGAGGIRTFLLIMLPNAIPPILTVTLFCFVWQYNDTFYTSLFMGQSELMPLKVAALPNQVSQFLPTLIGLSGNVKSDPNHVALVVDTGILLAIIPLIVMYVLVQRHFVESVERTGIIG